VVEERLPFAEHDRDDGHEQLIEQSLVGELRCDVAAANDPERVIAG
jgi:hypothetical protein